MWIIEEFERQLAKDVRDDNINGSISAAILHNDKLLWAKAFGTTTIEGNLPATPETIYRAGSIAKSFTAFLMMQLVQEGLIELGDPVEKYFPAVRELEGYFDSTPITFQQLASHTAGLIREPKLEKADAGPIDAWEDKVLQAIPKTAFESKPGERFSYSNIGYGILGVALARAANTPFITMIDEKIFKQLDMQNSFFVVPEHKLEHLAQGIGGGPFGDEAPDLEGPAREHHGRGYKVPNGGIYSTPIDLGKFLSCLMGYGNILEKPYLELMQTRQAPETTFHTYGLGFEMYQDDRLTIIGHSGGVLGYSSYFGFEKEHHYAVASMRNYNWGVTSWDLGQKILLCQLVDFEKQPY